MTLWRTVAKLWCHKLCAVFGAPCILSFGRHQIPILQSYSNQQGVMG